MEKEKKSLKASIKSILEKIGTKFTTLIAGFSGSSETLIKNIITISKRILIVAAILILGYYLMSIGYSIGFKFGYQTGKAVAFKEFLKMLTK